MDTIKCCLSDIPRTDSELARASPSLETEDIREVIVRARDGDETAIGMLLEQYRDYLRAIARRHMAAPLWRRMDASDLVQQTLMEAHHDLDGLLACDEPHLRATLRKILRCNVANAIRDHLHLEKRAMLREQPFNDGDEIAGSQTTPSIAMSRRETTERFMAVLETLPDDQADAVRMRYFEGASVGDIAAALNRSRGAAAGLLKRGLEVLRSKLGEEASQWM